VVSGVVEEGRRYESDDFNRRIEIAARDKYRVGVVMGEIDQRQKTLVFCAGQDSTQLRVAMPPMWHFPKSV